MTHQPDPETTVRRALDTQVRGIRADDQFVRSTVERSVRGRHAGNHDVLSFASAAASSPSPDEIGVYRWAASLPRGEDAQAAYIAEDVFHAGSLELTLPGAPEVEGFVEAAIDDGWIVSLDRGQGITESGILYPDGSFEAFAYQGPGGSGMDFAVSPDGTEASLRAAIISLPAGEKIGDLPNNVYITEAWTQSGYVYLDRGNESWWWRPGSDPIKIGGQHGFRGDGYGLIRTDDGCSTISKLIDDGTVMTIMKSCDRSLISLSPSAGRVLTTTGDVIGVPSGDLQASLAVPESFTDSFTRANDYGVVWEHDDSILLALHGPGTIENPGDGPQEVGPWPIQIVRCTISTNICERASDELTDKRGYLQPVPLK